MVRAPALPLWVTALRRGQRQNAREEQRAVTRGVTTRQAGATGGGSAPLLLDVVTGAVAAYSLRKLRTAYAGAAVRVRRSSDNAEQDIGFSGVDFDAGAFSAFVGGGSGLAAKWYDQSGNTNDVTQAVALEQPQVVLNVQNGRAGVTLDGIDDDMLSAISIAGKPVTMFAVLKPSNVSSNRHFIGADTNSGITYRIRPTGTQQLTKLEVADVGESTTPLVVNTAAMVAATYSSSGDYSFYLNGTPDGAGTNDLAIANSKPVLGSRELQWYEGSILEVVRYPVVQTGTNVSTAFDDIDLYYSIP